VPRPLRIFSLADGLSGKKATVAASPAPTKKNGWLEALRRRGQGRRYRGGAGWILLLGHYEVDQGAEGYAGWAFG